MGRKKANPFFADQTHLDVFGGFTKLLSFTPHPKQLEFYRLPNKIRVFCGGNRSGKTTTAIYEFVYAALGIHPWQDWPPPPLKLRVIGPDFNTVINEVHVPRFKELLPPGSYVWYAERRVLQLYNGSTIQFMSYDQDLDKFAGTSLHGVWFDEEPPRKIFNENLMRILDTKGKVLMTFTPVSGITWLYEFIMSDRRDEDGTPLIGIVYASTYDNPFIDKKEIERIKELCNDEDELAARIEGRFFTRSGLIFKEFDRSRHVIEPFDVPHDWNIYIGIDHHLRNPQAVVFVAVDPEDRLYVFDEFYEVALIDEVCNAIKSKIGDRKITLAIIDTNAATPDVITGRSAKNEYWKNGIYVVPAKKGKNSVLEGLSFMRRAFANDRLFIFRNCANLIRQLEMYRWADWSYRQKDRKDPREMPIKKESHLIDALRYVVHTDPRWRPSFLHATPAPRYQPLFKKTYY